MTPLFATVCFDVDSTLVSIEGIDEIAEGSEEIAALTDAAMSGRIPIDEVYERRLEIVRPDAARIEALGRRYVESIVPGAESLIARLRSDRVAVRLITAGIEQAILPLAAHLGVPAGFVHAVPLRFDSVGSYAGYDQSAPTARPGGKAVVIRNIRSRNKGPVAFVGDGVTDLETAPFVDRFIGFGGVVARDAVRGSAPHYVETFEQLVPLLYGEE
ncbi:MAG: HAD-IB family phosphatase [Thermoanaerobaculia bacterium]|nr:HAD-IB family phosphatase [Thermoanaerobaculia bacterium]